VQSGDAMNALTFDTLKAARRLRDEFGFDERQATGIVETFADGMTVSLDALATKQDLPGSPPRPSCTRWRRA